MQRNQSDHSSPRSVDPDQAAELLGSGALAVDVREDAEWQAGHLEGSQHQPLGDLDPGTLPDDRPLVAVCRSGRRSADAARQLEAAGRDVVNLSGGLKAWQASGRALVTPAGDRGELR